MRDQFVDTIQLDAADPRKTDSVDVFINGDQVANDHTPIWSTTEPGAGNREGFELIADAGGHQLTASSAFTNAAWKAGASRTPDGYIVELEIPLALIDTRDGPEYVPATAGSELRVNFGISDNDTPTHDQTDFGIVWAEDPEVAPWDGGEDFWTVSLRLAPKPTSRP